MASTTILKVFSSLKRKLLGLLHLRGDNLPALVAARDRAYAMTEPGLAARACRRCGDRLDALMGTAAAGTRF